MRAGDQAVDQKSTAAKKEARTDAELLRLFVEQHDQTAMAAIIGRHGPLVFGLCRNILRNEHDAADAFQATFLVLLKKARSIAKAASLASWLHGVACRVATRAKSQSMRRKKHESSGTEMTPTAPPVEAADEETVSLIHEELCNLPERFRLPLILCCLEGESREEAARQLGWTVGSLKGRLERGREMLRSRLARHGLLLSGAMLAGVLTQQALAEVPAALVSSTLKATLLVATGQSLVAGAVSTQAAVLTQGVLKAMLITKLKIAGLILLGGGVAATGSAVAVRHMLAAAPADKPAAAVAGKPAGGDDQTPVKKDNDVDEKLDVAQARAQSQQNIKRLGLAMHMYHGAKGAFPPAAVYGAGDKPLLSWRVLLLPYLEQKELYAQFKLDEPWDSAHNKPLMVKMPDVFAAPGLKREHPDATFYQVFTGKGTIFDGRTSLKIADITDGLANTALIVEAADAVPWTKPADLPYVANKPLPKLGGLSKEGFYMTLGDGSVRFIPKGVADPVLRPAITVSDGQPIDF